jgi:hypothetical protein
MPAGIRDASILTSETGTMIVRVRKCEMEPKQKRGNSYNFNRRWKDKSNVCTSCLGERHFKRPWRRFERQPSGRLHCEKAIRWPISSNRLICAILSQKRMEAPGRAWNTTHSSSQEGKDVHLSDFTSADTTKATEETGPEKQYAIR